jgi:hypothetical protein
VVSVLTTGHKGRGFKPGRSDVFSGISLFLYLESRLKKSCIYSCVCIILKTYSICICETDQIKSKFWPSDHSHSS